AIPCWACHTASDGVQGVCSLRLPLRGTEGGILTEGNFTHKYGLDQVYELWGKRLTVLKLFKF
ncbi:hypothetical protein D478_10585, partial [Brevibacillus agri BAB-2500]